MKVYLIKTEDSNLFKIGISKNPKQRIKNLQTANGSKLILECEFDTKFDFKLERYVQLNLINYKKEGEWFELTEGKNIFLELCKKGEEVFNSLKNNSYYNDNL